MAYNSNNYKQYCAHILELYKELKQPDIPDTRVLKLLRQRNHIYMSYRKWMYIKGMKPSDLNNNNQMKLF